MVPVSIPLGTAASDTAQTDGEYPPLIARSVQRRAADESGAEAGSSRSAEGRAGSAESYTGSAESYAGSAESHAGSPEPEPAQAPLSGFSAAISALQTNDPLFAAGEQTAATETQGSPTAAPELVVARHLAPDDHGVLPSAATRLWSTSSAAYAAPAGMFPTSSFSLPDQPGLPVQRSQSIQSSQPGQPGLPVHPSLPGHPSPVGQPSPVAHGSLPVQRSLLALRPSPLSPAPASPIGPVTPPQPADVQRIHYRDVQSPVPSNPGSPDVTGPDVTSGAAAAGTAFEGGSGSGGAGWDSGAAAWDSGAAGWGSVDTSASGGITMPTAPASAAWSPTASPALQRLEQNVSGYETTQSAVQRAPTGAAQPISMQAPAMRQQFDPPVAVSGASATSSAQATTSGPAADTPAMAVSSRTVGLSELFSMAAAQSAAEGATVQRLGTPPDTATSVTPSVETTVQTVQSSDSPAPTASPAPEAAPATPTAEQLEEMARRLYEPMASRIRAELWQDRERAGLLTDLRP